MKPLAYWEVKTKRTNEELAKIHARQRLLRHRHFLGMRRIRLWMRLSGRMGERIRLRNRIFLARMARLQRRQHMFERHLLYYHDRIVALRNFNRFDRARKQPPI